MAGGCSVLETTANPYILSMGSPETATRRLNIAQAFNPIGSILGILMSKYFILSDISLYSISGTYATLGLVLIVILVVILHNLLGLSLGFTIGRLLRLEKPKCVALSIEVGMQNSGLASSLANMHFAAYPLATVPGAIFSVWHNISGALAAKLFQRETTIMK